MELTKNRAVLDWIDQQVKLTQPDQVIWIDGSEQQLEALRKEACATGELHELNQEKLPGCYLHRSDPSDVARVESRTFICCKKQEDAGQERKGFAVHADTRGAGSDPPPAGADHGTVFMFFRVFGLLLFLSRVLAGKKRLGNGGQFVDGFFSLGIRRGNKFRHGGKIRRGEPSHDCQFS